MSELNVAKPPEVRARTEPQIEALEALRSRVVNMVLGVSCVFGTLAIVPILGRAQLSSVRWLGPLYLATLPLLLLAWLLRGRLSVRSRTLFIVGVSLLYGVTGIVGNANSNPVGFITAIVYATTLIGVRAGIATFAVAITALAAFARAFLTGQLVLGSDLNELVTSAPTWTSQIIVMVWVTALILGIISIMHISFLRSISTLAARTRDLERTERDLQDHKEHLEELVAERTTELEATQAELIQAERLAVLGRLTATVSHEIRNPLGTVKNALFSLSDSVRGSGNTRAERALNLAERNVVRCDDIITELLDFTRSPTLEQTWTEVDEWLVQLVDELRHLFTDVECDVRVSSDAAVALDRESLRRAVVNVINNAVQAATRTEAGVVAVETATVGDRVEIRVIDNGPGIDPEALDRIFEPLFSTKSFGVGLGLPIVKRIAEDHGGGVVVESQEGHGTTVTLWLPLVAA